VSEQTGTAEASSEPTSKPTMSKETAEERYLRQIRNAVCFMAVVLAAGIVVGVIGVVVAGSQLSHLNCQVTNSGNVLSSC
jgi:hypothetical protein